MVNRFFTKAHILFRIKLFTLQILYKSTINIKLSLYYFTYIFLSFYASYIFYINHKPTTLLINIIKQLTNQKYSNSISHIDISTIDISSFDISIPYNNYYLILFLICDITIITGGLELYGRKTSKKILSDDRNNLLHTTGFT